MLRVVVHLVREYFLQFCTHSLYIHGLIKCVEERSYTIKSGIYFYFFDNEDIFITFVLYRINFHIPLS
jgi:hypothetical protein